MARPETTRPGTSSYRTRAADRPSSARLPPEYPPAIAANTGWVAQTAPRPPAQTRGTVPRCRKWSLARDDSPAFSFLLLYHFLHPLLLLLLHDCCGLPPYRREQSGANRHTKPRARIPPGPSGVPAVPTLRDVPKPGGLSAIQPRTQIRRLLPARLLTPREERGPERRDRARPAKHRRRPIDQNIVAGLRIGIPTHIGDPAP